MLDDHVVLDVVELDDHVVPYSVVPDAPVAPGKESVDVELDDHVVLDTVAAFFFRLAINPSLLIDSIIWYSGNRNLSILIQSIL